MLSTRSPTTFLGVAVMTFLLFSSSSTTTRRIPALFVRAAFSTTTQTPQHSSSRNRLAHRQASSAISQLSLSGSTNGLSVTSSSYYRSRTPNSFQAFRLASSSVVEQDELDAALEDILGSALEDEPKTSSSTRPRRPMPAQLIEQDEDWDKVASSSAKSSTSSSDRDFVAAISGSNKDGTGNDDLKAMLSTSHPRWVEAGLHPAVIDVLSTKGITHFTPVQAEAFAPILARRDVIGRSRTGTGKTLAFGLPALTRLVRFTEQSGKREADSGRMKRGRTPSMLVLCPTRELARQVSDELTQVAKPLGLFVEVFHGGVSYDPQARALRSGIDVIVGTPGRIMDHMERGNIDLTECDIVVLDEADEMLNMGFAEDVETILEDVGSANQHKTQCLMFSATTPHWVQDIGRKYQEDVIHIDSTGEEGGARVAKTVRHLAVQLPPGVESKRAVLEDIIAVEISKDASDEDSDDEDLESSNPLAYAAANKKKKSANAMQQKIFGKTIVFTETKREADELVSGGVFKSLTAQALHGDVGQKQRDATLNAFRAGAFNVLVATDVAARGIDIQDVDLVVQFDPPRDVDTYVHRSGRTGRAGKKGISVLLFNPQQARDIVRIERDLGHGFKFDLVGPPSIESAMKAAARTSAIACKSIPDETAAFFRDAASALLEEEDDAADVVARCLAAISRRSTELQSRSLITGELGMATVEMTNARGRPVAPNDVMFTVGKLARMSRKDEALSFESDVGKIQTNFESGSAIFDMSVEDAKKLVEFSANIDAGGAVFSLLKELEIERGHHFGKERERRPGGKFGGRPNNNNNGRDFRKPEFRDRYGGGGGREQRHGNRSTGNYHGQNHRSSYEGRRNSGGGKSEFGGRYDSRRGGSSNSGW